MTTEKPRTIVEFVDDKKHDVAHGAQKIRINGTEVLVESDSIDLTFGDKQITKLTLTLLPTEVHFIHAEPEEAAEEPAQSPTGFEVGDRVRIQPNAQFISPLGLKQHPRSRELDNLEGVVSEGVSPGGNVAVRVANISTLTDFMILPEYLEKVTEPEPLKVGDTVLVPKGAMVYAGAGGRDFLSQINEFTPCEAEITDPDDDGNLRLKYNGADMYLVRPDQVTRVSS